MKLIIIHLFCFNFTFCGKHVLIIICEAGLKQHPVQSILFQNPFLVGGRGSKIPLKLTEGTAWFGKRSISGQGSQVGCDFVLLIETKIDTLNKLS